MGYRVLFTLNGFLNPVALLRRHLIVKSIQTEVLEVAAMNEPQTEDEVGLIKHVIACIFHLESMLRIIIDKNPISYL